VVAAAAEQQRMRRPRVLEAAAREAAKPMRLEEALHARSASIDPDRARRMSGVFWWRLQADLQ